MPSHPTVIQRLKQLWLRLTEPHPTLQTPEERRQVRFLISLLLALTLLIIVLVPLWIILLDPKPLFWQETPFQIGIITSLGLVFAYALSRTRYYSGAALLAVAIIIINVFIAAIPDRSWTEILVFDYLLVAILLSSIFFSLSTTVIIAGACLVGMLFFPIFVPTIPPDEIVVRPVSFILMGSVLILLTTHHRNLLEKDRQAALVESENKYRSLLEQAVDGICIADAQGNYELVNPKACQMLGYSEAEFLQLNIRDLVPAEELAEKPLRLDELLAGKAITTERHLRRKDGSLLLVEISAAMINGRQLQAIIRDITERKQVEEALRQSEERYRAVVENQTELVIRALPDTTVTFVNEAYCQFLGLTRSQIIGRKYLELIPQPAREATQRHLADLMAQPRIAKDEHETLLPDGQIVWQQWIDRPILDAQGQVIEFLSVGRDITERKKAEEALVKSQQRLAMAQAIAHFGNWELNPKSGEGYWSEEMFHIHSRDPRLGPPSFEEFVAYIHPEDRAGLLEFHAQIMRSREPLSHDYRINRPDGSLRYLNTVAYSVWDEAGQLVHLAGTTLDITERKRVEAEIQRLNEELEQRVLERTAQLEAVNKEMEAFSYSVSHDLRAPLRAIDGFSQALLEDYADKLDEDGQDYLQRVRKATQRMGRLIDDMLGLSRITRSEMHWESVNLSAIVDAIAAELQQTEPQRSAEFVITPGVSVEGDPPLLRMALENLIGNAWKFTQKQPQARIEFGQIQEQDKLICFIRDNGVGFDMSYADKLFGPFQRLHTRHEFEGTGIGLATVQRVITRHGGRIWAESAPGQGATFYFIL
ncbi:MAG: PAS domain S-box protein [Anaerolineae bacterium]|nr:PAS domain S-box protein [Anaerolineae bacterium]